MAACRYAIANSSWLSRTSRPWRCRPARGPFTLPIWYQYAPGGEAWVLTEAGSRKARLIEAAGRFTLMVDRVMPTVRYVSAEGPVTRTVPGTSVREPYRRPWPDHLQR
jgi:hypothetical protein